MYFIRILLSEHQLIKNQIFKIKDVYNYFFFVRFLTDYFVSNKKLSIFAAS